MLEEPKSKLGKLYHKFQNSGIEGNPVITNEELTTLHNEILAVATFMEDIGHYPMKKYFHIMLDKIDNMTRARIPF